MDTNKLLVAPEVVEEEDEIDILDLLYYYRQHLFFIIASLLLCAAVAIFGSYLFITPTYEATSQIYIVSASNDSVVNLTDLQIGSSLASDYADLLTSRPMMESTLQDLNLDYTVNALRAMLEIENPDDTRILKITATTTDAQLSADIANKVAELSIEWLPSVMECEEPNIVEDAIPATEKAGPSLKKAAVIGALIGLVFSVGLCTVRYMLNDTIRSAEDLERYFGMPPIVSIPEDHTNPGLLVSKDGKKSSSKKKKSGSGTRSSTSTRSSTTTRSLAEPKREAQPRREPQTRKETQPRKGTKK